MRNIFLIGVAGISYLAYKTYTKAKAIYDLDISLHGLKNIRFGLVTSKVDIDIKLINKSKTDINISSGSLALIKRITLYSAKGTLIGHSDPGDVSFNIPAGGTQIIRNIPVTINSAYVIEALGNLPAVGDISITVDVQIGGKTITIN